MFAQCGKGTLFGGVPCLAQRRILCRGVGEQKTATTRRSGRAQLVHSLGQRRSLILKRYRVAMLVDRAEGLMQLDVGAMGQPLDDAGLDAVLEHRPIAALQSDTPPICDEVDERRQNHHADAANPRGCIQRNMELQRDDVVHRRESEHHIEGDRHGADRGAHRNVPWPLQQVVMRVVAGKPLLQEWVGG
ncbi:Uncharacterised protein [Mycobacterium tuberculosis]|nr:Uncharacterised protein [Mycobacterium tuberculosis]